MYCKKKYKYIIIFEIIYRQIIFFFKLIIPKTKNSIFNNL